MLCMASCWGMHAIRSNHTLFACRSGAGYQHGSTSAACDVRLFQEKTDEFVLRMQHRNSALPATRVRICTIIIVALHLAVGMVGMCLRGFAWRFETRRLYICRWLQIEHILFHFCQGSRWHTGQNLLRRSYSLANERCTHYQTCVCSTSYFSSLLSASLPASAKTAMQAMSSPAV